MENKEITASNFIEEEVIKDIESDRFGRPIQTRFPPEPNGYLHIGHAKAICIDFMTAKKFGGRCNLRFDDTNPTKEDTEYVDSIMNDIRWLGFSWDELHYASSYFETFYECALKLIREGKARVRVLETGERWYGVTYREDLPEVQAAMAEMRQKNLYPEKLW